MDLSFVKQDVLQRRVSKLLNESLSVRPTKSNKQALHV